jgi:hypothetical protein
MSTAMPRKLGSRPYLAFFRAGANSFHTRILEEDPNRNWDCCVSWYGSKRMENLAEVYTDGGDNKFEGFEIFLSETGGCTNYQYVFVIDDDVLFSPGDVSRYFDICRSYDLYLSQPALSWRSYYSHPVTLRNPACALRRVSFIEVMAPCFSKLALSELRKTFLHTKSTWGIDWAWSAEVANRRGFFVVDQIPVVHTKPIDPTHGAFYKHIRNIGVDIEKETTRVFATYPEFNRKAQTQDKGHTFKAWVPMYLSEFIMSTIERCKVAAYAWMLMRQKWRGVVRRTRSARHRLGITA